MDENNGGKISVQPQHLVSTLSLSFGSSSEMSYKEKIFQLQPVSNTPKIFLGPNSDTIEAKMALDTLITVIS